MSPSSSLVLPRRRSRRPSRPTRARNRLPRRVAISALVMMAMRSRMSAISSALVVTAVWSIATYFTFSDNVPTQARQTETQITYEDHIAELRARIDRIISGKFHDQAQVEQQLTALLKRQAMLEQRASALAGALDKAEQEQAATLTDLEERIGTRASRIHSVLVGLGFDSDRAKPKESVGGPFVPFKPSQSGDSAFARQLNRINVAFAQIDRYTHTLVAVPVRKPIVGEMDMSSPFGIRRDPFLGRPAVHPGIDLRGQVGEPVRATATGRVSIAGRERGYGNMVEINHGNGLATRYGHLSVITVKIGQFVRIGEIVGKIGSTGRSTGPHLHYETRINGEPVDPQKFLRAGLRLGNENDLRNSVAPI